MSKVRRRGFTLIELLVVIAIIAILAGILFPVFAKAREKAYTVDCLSNVKQLGMSFVMYASDWNNKLPTAAIKGSFRRDSDWVKIMSDSDQADISVGRGSLFQYVKSEEAYVCKNAVDAQEKGPSGGTRTSYTMNGNLMNWRDSYTKSLKLSRVKYPANTFLLIEEHDELPASGSGTGYNDGFYYAPDPRADHRPSGWGFACDYPAGKNESERHNGGAIVAYVDGHSKWHTYQDLVPFGPGASESSPNSGKLFPYYHPVRSAIESYP
ncbi:MAG: prepilin-type N-terminal cleavage/methylation domain-containing protein [Armatimonadetes bacterium]|nr:prepilin-type N-terminal cleavage/methylation domain-containing protein [Armatimonadota bacterium]